MYDKNTAKYALSFSRNFCFLSGLFFYAAPCIFCVMYRLDFMFDINCKTALEL